MSGEARIARLERVRRHQQDLAGALLKQAQREREAAQATASALRALREAAQEAAQAAAAVPQPASSWLAQRLLVEGRLEKERLAELASRRLARQEALRRVDLRAARVRVEQMRALGAQLSARSAQRDQRLEQRVLDDLRREGGEAL